MTAFIYALTEPMTHEIRYIGYSNNPQNRLEQHILDACRMAPGGKYPFNSKKDVWLRTLVAQGLKPSIQILSTCTIEEKAFYEAFWGEILQDEALLNTGKFARNYRPTK